MARPIEPRVEYSREIRSLTTLRNVVGHDNQRGEAWRREAQARIDALIRHLTEPPPASADRKAA